MRNKLVLIASGGALAFALAGLASPGTAVAGTHPAGAAPGLKHLKLSAPTDSSPPISQRPRSPQGLRHLKLSAPDGTPIIRDSAAHLRPGHGKIWAPSDPP